MAYSSDKKPLELTALTSLATDDTFIVGDTSDTSEVAKSITKANLMTDLGLSFTAGSVPFAGPSGPLTQDNSNFKFDNTANQLQLGGGDAANANGNQQYPLIVGGNINDYLVMEVKNASSGDTASSDIIATADNDNGLLVGHYVDMGINGSGYLASALGNVKSVSINTAGTGYTIGDILTIVGGDNNATVSVTTVSGGAVTSVTIEDNGTNYSITSALSVTGGTGSGFKINILTLYDSTIWAANACYLVASGGYLTVGTDDGVASQPIIFHTNGTGATNERARITDTQLQVGKAGTTLGKVALQGSTSGSITLQAQAVSGSSVLTLPVATDTLVGKATTDTFTNKTLGSLLLGFTTTATAAGTTTLTISSTPVQVFTGTTTQTVTLPTTSVPAGGRYIIINNSTGLVTVQSSGANTITILGASTSAIFTAVVATPTTAANWNSQYIGIGITSGKKLSVSNSLTLAGTDSTTMTFPSTSATIARTDAAQTFTGIQTYSNAVNYTNNAITASGNAATVPITARIHTVTNNSAATLTITMTTGAVDGQLQLVRILDASAVAQTISWVNTENSTATVPTTTNGSTTLPLTVMFQYNNATSKWRCLTST